MKLFNPPFITTGVENEVLVLLKFLCGVVLSNSADYIILSYPPHDASSMIPPPFNCITPSPSPWENDINASFYQYLSLLLLCLFVYFSICLFICLSICLFVYLSICLFVYLYICLFVYLSICQLAYLSICILVCLSIYLFVYLSIYLFVYLSICLLTYLSIDLFVYWPICLSVYLSICIYVYLSIGLFVYLSIYISVSLPCEYDDDEKKDKNNSTEYTNNHPLNTLHLR